MKHLLLLTLSLLLAAKPTRAQTQLDPSFQPVEIFQPAQVLLAVQTSSGARVLLGSQEKAEGLPSHGLERYLPSGQLDATFHANVQGAPWTATQLDAAPGDKVVLCVTSTATQLGQVLRLLPNGQPDPGFVPYQLPYNSIVKRLLVQPDGKVLLGGSVVRPGTTTPDALVRLNADGSLDTAFLTASGAGFSGGIVSLLVLQADGNMLAGGDFTGVQGVPQRKLARLLASGSLDPTFAPQLNATARLQGLGVQPNGSVLISTSYQGILASSPQPFVRLTPTGSHDTSFQPPSDVTPVPSPSGPSILVQPDGRVLVANGGGQGQLSTYSFVARLLPSGALDPSWSVANNKDVNALANSLQLLPTGEVLVAVPPHRFAGPTALPTGVGVLSATGSHVPAFAPLLLENGQLSAMALQPDGKIVITGSFCEINGTPVRNLARLLPTGALDAAFAANCPLSGGYGGLGRAVAVQPDGRILVAGSFGQVGARPNMTLARVLPDGQPDASFTSPMLTGAFDFSTLENMALQADGQVLAAGVMTLPNGRFLDFARFSASGQLDASYQYGLAYRPAALLPLPNGKLLVGGSFPSTSGPTTLVNQLLPNGQPDPAFTPVAAPTTGFALVHGLARQPADDKVLVYGYFSSLGGLSTNALRLQPNGQPDPSLRVDALTSLSGSIYSLAVQPNGRLLLAGQFNVAGNSSSYHKLARLSATGTVDASFDRSQAPTAPGAVVSLLAVQPDGRLLLGGYFREVAGQPRRSIARLLDANVLGVAARPAAPATQAWPVPTREVLHLALDGAARPRLVQLLDALGRPVLQQAVGQPTLSLRTAALAPGPYVLRVEYASGPVLRRIVLE